MALQLTTEQKVTLHAQPVTAAGSPALVEGPIAWSVSDPAILTLVPSADGSSCEVITTGATGIATVTATGDANLDPLVTENVFGSMEFEIVVAKAAAIAIFADEPVLKA